MTSPGSGKSVSQIDTSKPHSARMYDYYLGGKDWYEADQEAAEKVKGFFPQIGVGAQANRDFMHRATRTLVRDYGIRQFVDIGTGIPTEPNLHQVAQGEAPEARVVYVDYDPLVLEHADALMRSAPEGRTAYIQADFRHDAILDDPRLREIIDLTEPVVLSLVALVQFVPDEGRPIEIVHRLLDRLAPGSFLVISHATHEFDPEAWERIMDVYRGGDTVLQTRTKPEVARFFEGLELIEPGLSLAHEWRPDGPTGITAQQAPVWVGVARKN